MRKEKQLLLDEVKNQIGEYPSFVIMRYSSLKANDANQFRSDIAKIGGSYEVMRKRLLLKAAAETGVQLDLAALPGHIGIVYAGSDPIETTKLVFKFGQDKEKAVEVLGGRFDGQLYNAAQMEMLSQLPSKDEMRAQFLGTLEAPMAQTLAVIDALLTSVCHCLENKSQQGQGSDS